MLQLWQLVMLAEDQTYESLQLVTPADISSYISLDIKRIFLQPKQHPISTVNARAKLFESNTRDPSPCGSTKT